MFLNSEIGSDDGCGCGSHLLTPFLGSRNSAVADILTERGDQSDCTEASYIQHGQFGYATASGILCSTLNDSYWAALLSGNLAETCPTVLGPLVVKRLLVGVAATGEALHSKRSATFANRTIQQRPA
jgi:hypothetical protein